MSLRAENGPADADTTDPERFGRYEIVHKLASGGMGEVFLARAVGAAGFQKHVVIKKLLPHLVEQSQFVEGLIREAKLLVRLDHPNIVQVLDLGMEGDDYFMAMEYVHGYNLATIIHYCAQSQLVMPATACAFVALQVLTALEYAHSQTGPDGVTRNVIHRDVSPQNVLISNEGRVKLTDFGIAKVVNEAEGELTQSLKGKFRYMAPEVVDGGRIDQRYDLFAVGILLFESLCRRHLFSGSNDINILDQVRRAHVPPISRYHPQVPRELTQVVEKALAKDPARRYQDATAFAGAVREALQPASESETAAELRRFITDLYTRHDFPINKPKLPDLVSDGSATRSLVLKSRLVIAGHRAAAEPPRRRASTLLVGSGVLAGVATMAAVGYLALRPPDAPPPQAGTAVVVVSPRAPEARAPAPRDAAPAVAVPPDARARVTKVPPKRSGPFNHIAGQSAFRRNGAALTRCFNQHAAAGQSEVRLKVLSAISAGGRVTEAKLDPTSLEGSDFGRCVLKVARAIRYPPHDKPTINFLQPLALTRQLKQQ